MDIHHVNTQTHICTGKIALNLRSYIGYANLYSIPNNATIAT